MALSDFMTQWGKLHRWEISNNSVAVVYNNSMFSIQQNKHHRWEVKRQQHVGDHSKLLHTDQFYPQQGCLTMKCRNATSITVVLLTCCTPLWLSKCLCLCTSHSLLPWLDVIHELCSPTWSLYNSEGFQVESYKECRQTRLNAWPYCSVHGW